MPRNRNAFWRSARKYTEIMCFSVALTSLSFLAGGAASADETFKATSAITIPGNALNSFDISFVDPATRLYLLADRSNKSVDVIDTVTNTVQFQTTGFVGFTGNNDTSGPNGVLTVNHREAWAGDGDSTIKVIDLFTHAVTHTISTNGVRRADEMCFDEREQIVEVANDAESDVAGDYPFVSYIATSGPNAYTVLGTIVMDGGSGPHHGPKATNGIEQCQWDRRTGKIYLNLPEVNGPGDDSAPGATLVIDPKSMEIEQIFPIPYAYCAGPQGMALGPDNQILLGCNAANLVNSTVIIDKRDGHTVAALPFEAGADEVWFNPGDGHYFMANSAATTQNTPPAFTTGPSLGVLGVIDSLPRPQEDSSTVTNVVQTGSNSAHSVAADPHQNQVYVPVPHAPTAARYGQPGYGSSTSHVCSAVGGDDAQGCVLVYTTTNDDPPVWQQEQALGMGHHGFAQGFGH
jgi:hypothetical protein